MVHCLMHSVPYFSDTAPAWAWNYTAPASASELWDVKRKEGEKDETPCLDESANVMDFLVGKSH